MTKDTAFTICEFIINHYDTVWQEDWFELQAILLEAVVNDANERGYAKSLAQKFPCFFEED